MTEFWYQEDEKSQIRVSYKIKNILFSDKSEFQTVDVVDTVAYGRMLLLDGLVMITDKDEFVYHEVIAHLPVINHPNPKKVVVIGGGDGGTVRELLKHPEIEEIVLCEIDGMVVDASRKFFPAVACGLDDPRVKVNIDDGVAYMVNHKPGDLDIVIVDSTDPIGPGEGLFSGDFYRSVQKSLKPDGIMICQSESMWFEPEILQRIYRNVSAGFKHIKPFVGPVPTYPRGTWSWTMASNRVLEPREYNRQRFDRVKSGLRYLNEDVVMAGFALPNFYAEKLKI